MANPNQAREETHFSNLYAEVCDGMGIDPAVFERAVETVRAAFRFSEGGRFSDIDFGQPENVWAYLTLFGSHGASLTRFRVLQAANVEVEPIPGRSLGAFFDSKVSLRVVSLGGGPGNDALGFCSALSQLDFQGSLHITVVDAVEQWENCIREAVRLVREQDFGSVTQLFRQNRVSVEFLHTRLPSEAESYRTVMSGADVVLMTKLMSSVRYDEIDRIISSVHEMMSPKALLIFINSPFNEEKWIGYFRTLYVSEDGEEYRAVGNMRPLEHTTSTARIAILSKK